MKKILTTLAAATLLNTAQAQNDSIVNKTIDTTKTIQTTQG